MESHQVRGRDWNDPFDGDLMRGMCPPWLHRKHAKRWEVPTLGDGIGAHCAIKPGARELKGMKILKGTNYCFSTVTLMSSRAGPASSSLAAVNFRRVDVPVAATLKAMYFQ